MVDQPLRCRHKVPVSGSRMLKLCGNEAFMTELGPRCAHHAPDLRKRSPNPQRTRAIIECDKLRLSREERHDLARMLVGHEGSWSNLSEEDGRRIADAAKAFLVIQALVLMRRMSNVGAR